VGSSGEDVPEEGSETAHWLKRPFARTFDLILSEYAGYTDETILELRLGRIRQMRDVILERQKEEWQRHLMLEETKLRNICGAVYGASGSKDGVKSANSIELFERPKKLIVASSDRIKRMFG
jgi:hypothetical protein